MIFLSLTHSGGSFSSNPAAAIVTAWITPKITLPATIFLPAGVSLPSLYMVSAIRAVPCTLALKNAYNGVNSLVLAPVLLKLTVRFLAILADWSWDKPLLMPSL